MENLKELANQIEDKINRGKEEYLLEIEIEKFNETWDDVKLIFKQDYDKWDTVLEKEEARKFIEGMLQGVELEKQNTNKRPKEAHIKDITERLKREVGNTLTWWVEDDTILFESIETDKQTEAYIDDFEYDFEKTLKVIKSELK